MRHVGDTRRGAIGPVVVIERGGRYSVELESHHLKLSWNDLEEKSVDAALRPRSRSLQGRPRLRRVLRRVVQRIYETRTGPPDLRWFWALHAPSKPGTLRTDSGSVAGPSQGEVRGELEAVESVGRVGGGYRT